MEKTAGATTTRYVYDGKNVLAILDQNNNVTQFYTQGPGIDAPVSARINGTDYYYHQDALGSVTALSDQSGALVERVEYQAFGKAVVKDAQGNAHTASTVGNPFLYTGREFDAETGLYYYRARYLDAETGRFLQEDPIGNTNGTSLYAYTDDDPLLYTDSFGLYLRADGPTTASGHVDIGISLPIARGVIATAGVQLDPYGRWEPYLGGGLGTPGGSVVGSAGGIKTSWNPTTLSGNLGPYSAFLTGTIDTQGSLGLGAGTPGFSLTKVYVFPPDFVDRLSPPIVTVGNWTFDQQTWNAIQAMSNENGSCK